jgi:TetR/AcrR family transcriptional repressor of nem operon
MNARTTREEIVEAADALFYRRGFEHTSFADIAEIVKISRGNFYYHFKTKDKILEAVIQQREAATLALIQDWEAAEPTPQGRIRRYIHIVIDHRPDIRKYGCPVGTLTTELAQLGHGAQPQARRIFTLFRDWLRRQFEALGRVEDADALAMEVLAFSQGVAVMDNAFQDEAFVRREVMRMDAWLDAITKQRN